jgi:D-alanine-D-alanine ligase
MERRKEALGGSCFAEVYVPGREFNVSVLEGPGGPEILPPAEMLFEGYPAGKPKVVGYRAKWEESSFEFRHTGRSFAFDPVDGPLLHELSELALRCFRVFGLRGYARVDFRVDETGRPLILEVNANPCLSPDSGFTAAAMQAGLDHAQVIQATVEAAVRHAGLGRASPGEGPLRESQPYSPTHGVTKTEAHLGLGMRDHLTVQDRQAIERLANATGFFSLAERDMILELVDAWLRGGVASGYHFIVASSGGDLVGFVCYGPVPATAASFEVYWIAVHPHHQRRKIGGALLAKAEHRIGLLGGGRIYVSTAGRPQYLPTRIFYEANGYRQEARLGDYHAPGDDRLVYVKILNTEVSPLPTEPQ